MGMDLNKLGLIGMGITDPLVGTLGLHNKMQAMNQSPEADNKNTLTAKKLRVMNQQPADENDPNAGLVQLDSEF